MMWTQDAARELVADRLRTLQAAYASDALPAMPRRTRRSWRLADRRAKAEPGRARLAAGHSG